VALDKLITYDDGTPTNQLGGLIPDCGFDKQKKIMFRMRTFELKRTLVTSVDVTRTGTGGYRLRPANQSVSSYGVFSVH